MGVLQSLFEKQEKKHSLGVCIPEAGKQRVMEQKLQRDKMVREEIGAGATGGALEVTGIFHFQSSLMVEGRVIEGSIRKKATAEFRGAKLRVDDLQASNKSPGILVEGERGAIFLKAENGKYPLIRTGDVLEF